MKKVRPRDQYMNFFEAMTALQNGRKVRISSWDKGQWIGLREHQFKMFGLPKSTFEAVNQSGSVWGNNTSFNPLLAAEWEEYKESVEEKKS